MGEKELEAKEEYDPWALIDPPNTGKKWGEKSCGEKLLTVIKVIFLTILLIGFLYIFICSLDFLSNAFRLLGGKTAGEAFRANEILTNPICDLMIGVLATVLLQSSSTTTSITVAMVAAQVIPIRPAIFIVMGANIGTSVTNTIVALGQAIDKQDFRRAFAGATVHDMFNWLSVLVLLPIEWITGAFDGAWKDCGLICQITGAITDSIRREEQYKKPELLHAITWPFSHSIVWLDQFVVADIATWNVTAKGPIPDDITLMRYCTKEIEVPYVGSVNGTCVQLFNKTKVDTNCGYLFEGVKRKWSDTTIGAVLLPFALFVLLSMLVCMVKVLQKLLQGNIARFMKKFLNSNLPCGKCGEYFTGYIAMLVGAGVTMVLQSSSVFTSALTPLVGVGVLHIERMYPLTLGANVGTTLTAILASLGINNNFADAFQTALCHLFFNLLGVLVWYPLPFMRKVPIALAKTLGNTVGKYRWFAGVYIALVFFIFPGGTFLLSLLGWKIVLGVAGPIFFLFFIVGIINAVQNKCPNILPSCMRDWSCCPKFLHSLAPYDKICSFCCRCCRNCQTDKENDNHEDIHMTHDEPDAIQINGTAKKESYDEKY